jgi:hypothetical protein
MVFALLLFLLQQICQMSEARYVQLLLQLTKVTVSRDAWLSKEHRSVDKICFSFYEKNMQDYSINNIVKPAEANGPLNCMQIAQHPQNKNSTPRPTQRYLRIWITQSHPSLQISSCSLLHQQIGAHWGKAFTYYMQTGGGERESLSFNCSDQPL